MSNGATPASFRQMEYKQAQHFLAGCELGQRTPLQESPGAGDCGHLRPYIVGAYTAQHRPLLVGSSRFAAISNRVNPS